MIWYKLPGPTQTVLGEASKEVSRKMVQNSKKKYIHVTSEFDSVLQYTTNFSIQQKNYKGTD